MHPARRPLPALAALLAGLALSGCGNLSEDDLFFFAGLPQKRQLEMRPAGEPSTAEEGNTAEQALETPCEEGDLRCHARDVAHMLNGVSFALIDLIDEALKHPPTRRERDRRVWGPVFDPAKQATFRFEMVRMDDPASELGTFVLCAHGVAGRVRERLADEVSCDTDVDEETGLALLLSGQFTPGELEGARARTGVGSLALELSRVEPLKGVGRRLTVDFDNDDDRTELHLSVNGALLAGTNIERERVDYDFAREADGSGTLHFDTFADLAPDQPGVENLVIGAAWDAEQAGRAEAAVSRVADLENPLFVAVQCWDAGLGTVFFRANTDTTGNEAACVFLAL
ncbi:MAG: hypothetical protein A2138_06635 [Deltaproteobacteria bacterium RBG_16_71_12]|nr:MAG: hypothetical protein A2138_06635 [Deltaproteobacteria bacterium RBG_16_71_12]